jgi:hypothetical protein
MEDKFFLKFSPSSYVKFEISYSSLSGFGARRIALNLNSGKLIAKKKGPSLSFYSLSNLYPTPFTVVT